MLCYRPAILPKSGRIFSRLKYSSTLPVYLVLAVSTPTICSAKQLRFDRAQPLHEKKRSTDPGLSQCLHEKCSWLRVRASG